MERPLDSDEVFATPVMQTLPRGFVVRAPQAEAARAEVGPLGGVSVGPCHLPGHGPVVILALHSEDGQTLLATMGEAGFMALAGLLSNAGARIAAGEFNEPEAMQS